MFAKPLVFNSLDTVCIQRVFAEIAQSKASPIILFLFFVITAKSILPFGTKS